MAILLFLIELELAIAFSLLRSTSLYSTFFDFYPLKPANDLSFASKNQPETKETKN